MTRFLEKGKFSLFNTPFNIASLFIFSLLEEMRVLMCVMSTAHVICVVCNELCVMTYNSKA